MTRPDPTGALIAANVVGLLERRPDLTTADLARALDRSRSTVRRRLDGHGWDVDETDRAARLLDVRASDLFRPDLLETSGAR